MAEFRLTHQAVEDLSQIWEYTYSNWSEQQSDSYYLELISACQKIAENPDLGKSYDGVSEQLLGLISNKHIIFYRRITKDYVEITRILHERMDLKNRIAE